jgi:hypothetical protein
VKAQLRNCARICTETDRGLSKRPDPPILAGRADGPGLAKTHARVGDASWPTNQCGGLPLGSVRPTGGPKTDNAQRLIGIGGSLATSPLPHHRTYGSVSGGSVDYAVCGAAIGRTHGRFFRTAAAEAGNAEKICEGTRRPLPRSQLRPTAGLNFRKLCAPVPCREYPRPRNREPIRSGAAPARVTRLPGSV